MASNVPTVDKTNSDKTRYCAYCRNHGKQIPLIGHRPCPFNNVAHFEDCNPCKQNNKKTINVNNHREKQKKRKLDQNENQGREDSCLSQAQTTDSATDFTDHQVMSDDIQMTDYNPDENFNGTSSININNDTIIYDTIEVDKMLETFGDIPADSPPITDTIQEEYTDDNEHGFEYDEAYFVQPTNYPDETLSRDEVEQFQSNLQNIIDKIPENNRQPKFLVNRYSSNRWELKFADKYTVDWLEIEFFNITTYKNSLTKPLRILPKSFDIVYIFEAYFNRSIFEKEFEIISSFHRQNRGLDTSRWEILNKKESQEEVKLTFKVDPLSYMKLKENDFILYIGGNHVKLSLVKDWRGNLSNLIMSKKTHGKIDPP